MKKIISLFALTLMSSGVSAVQATPTPPIKIDFSGEFNSSSGTYSREAFSGSFMFDLQNPDNSTITSSSFEFGYTTQAQATLSFSSQNIHFQNIHLEIVDNYLISTDSGEKQSYDVIGLTSHSDKTEFASTNNKELFKELINGIQIGFFAIFDSSAFDLSNMTPAELLKNLKSTPLTPFITGLNLIKMENSSEIYSAAGTVTDASVSAVPLPTAFWLFTSAVAALGFRFRQRA